MGKLRTHANRNICNLKTQSGCVFACKINAKHAQSFAMIPPQTNEHNALAHSVMAALTFSPPQGEGGDAMCR